jgi:hypothetical protein
MSQRAKEATGQFESLPRVIRFELGLSPRRVSSRGEGSFQAQLANQGDDEITLELSGTDPEEACTYRFQPERVTLGPQERREVPILITPRSKPPRGMETNYEFTIEATPVGALHLTKAATGQLEVLRPKRRWGLIIAAAALIALIAALFLCWTSGTLQDLLGSAVPGRPAPAPGGEPELVADFWAEPEVIRHGECTVLRWEVEGAEGVYLEGPGFGFEAPPFGEREVCPEGSSEYILLATIGRREVELYAGVRVTE